MAGVLLIPAFALLAMAAVPVRSTPVNSMYERASLCRSGLRQSATRGRREEEITDHIRFWVEIGREVQPRDGAESL